MENSQRLSGKLGQSSVSQIDRWYLKQTICILDAWLHCAIAVDTRATLIFVAAALISYIVAWLTGFLLS
jgi:hypothetical protein